MVRRFTTTDIRMRKKPHIIYVEFDDYDRLATLARALAEDYLAHRRYHSDAAVKLASDILVELNPPPKGGED